MASGDVKESRAQQAEKRSSLERIVGEQYVNAAKEGEEVDGVMPGWVVEPGGAGEVAGVLKYANELGMCVVARGAGTKLAWGYPPNAVVIVLSTRRMNRVVEHAAGDMTARVEAGCTVGEFQRVLAERGQRLAVDVLWPARATIGGILATNDSGTLRHAFGALRDQLIGITVVLADGTIAKSGGKVVKNVAGYDLPKLMIGSFGTLGVIVEATFRLYPVAKASRLLRFTMPGRQSLAAMVERLPEHAAAVTSVQIELQNNRETVVRVRVEGMAEVIEEKVERVRAGVFGGAVPVDGTPDPWEFPEMLFGGDDCTAKIGVLPTQWAEVFDWLTANRLKYPKMGFRVIGQAMGIGWLSMSGGNIEGALADARRYFESIGGTMTLLHAPALVKRHLGVWPEVGDALPLMQRVKKAFDARDFIARAVCRGDLMKLDVVDNRQGLEEMIGKCVHCGFCLPTCPTYKLWGEEADSPRGRIYLMKLELNGEAEMGEDFVGHFDRCLGCMACVTSCPSGVEYGKLIEATRAKIEREYERPLAERILRWMVFAVFPYPARLRALLAPAWIYQRSGLQGLVRRTGLIRRLPSWMQAMEGLMPEVRLGNFLPAENEVVMGKGKRVGVLLGCVQRVLFGGVNEATVRILRAEGCEVIVPEEQGCCGALMTHAGEEERAVEFAKREIDVFEAAKVEMVAVNAAGCGSAMKEYGYLLKGDRRYGERARVFSEKCRDVSEVLLEVGGRARRGRVELKAAFQDACHLRHAQGITAGPRKLLSGVPGLELREIADGEICCGSAGIYNLVQPEAARELGLEKARRVLETGAEVVVTGNPGCALQLKGSLRALGKEMPVVHWVELMDASICGRIPEALRDHLSKSNRS